MITQNGQTFPQRERQPTHRSGPRACAPPPPGISRSHARPRQNFDAGRQAASALEKSGRIDSLNGTTATGTSKSMIEVAGTSVSLTPTQEARHPRSLHELSVGPALRQSSRRPAASRLRRRIAPKHQMLTSVGGPVRARADQTQARLYHGEHEAPRESTEPEQ